MMSYHIVMSHVRNGMSCCHAITLSHRLEEDNNISRTEESLGLFQKIVENQYFLNTCIILFLNKKDLLEQKLKQGIKIEDFFDYDPDDFDGKDSSWMFPG